MAENFFFRQAQSSVFNALKQRKNFDAILHSARAIIKSGGTQIFPNNKSNSYQLIAVSVEESGDYMTSRRCDLSIWCPTYALFEELEPRFASLESVDNPITIQFEWDDGIKSKEFKFIIHQPSFKFNNDGSVTIQSKGIGPGPTQLTVNTLDTPFDKKLPGYMFISDYGGIFGERFEYINSLTDYIDWTIQQGTNQGSANLFDPEHGASGQFNGISNPTAWWTTLTIDDDLYESKQINYQDSMWKDSYALTYVTLSALAEIFNKYYNKDAEGNEVEIRCNSEVTKGATAFKTSDGVDYKIFSPDPVSLLFPYSDGTSSDYASIEETSTSGTYTSVSISEKLA